MMAVAKIKTTFRNVFCVRQENCEEMLQTGPKKSKTETKQKNQTKTPNNNQPTKKTNPQTKKHSITTKTPNLPNNFPFLE